MPPRTGQFEQDSLCLLQAHGMDRVCISTGITNPPALGFYSSLGFTVVNRYLDYIQSSGLD